MIALQIFGFEFGFDIWPTGEFRNWIDILQSDFGHALNASEMTFDLRTKASSIRLVCRLSIEVVLGSRPTSRASIAPAT